MKIINKEGKIFNKINILDFIFIAAIIFLLFLSVIKVMGKDLQDINVSSDVVDIEVKVSVIMKEGYLDSIAPGQQLGEMKQYLDAYIKTVDILPVEETNSDSQGNKVVSINPTLEKAEIVFTATVPYESMSYKLGKQEIRQGKLVFLESDFYRYKVQIESIKVVN